MGVARNDATQLKDLLVGVEIESLHVVLASPVNTRLDTLLHLAVTRKNADAVETLLAYRASPTQRNPRGDLPIQHFALPRCTRAASIIRLSSRGLSQRTTTTRLVELI